MPSSYKVVSPINFLGGDAKVSELIDPKKKEWEVNLVRQILWPQEADMVLGIPLSISLPPDKLLWACIANENFTVHSAYNLIMEEIRNTRGGESSDETVLRQVWKGIWSMKTPKKKNQKLCLGDLSRHPCEQGEFEEETYN